MVNHEEKKEAQRMSASSDEGIAYYNASMLPYEIVLFDGTSMWVPYSKLDEKLAELKETFKERKRGKR